MIQWSSKGKEGDPIPWPYRPFCKYCSNPTEYVINPELGFHKSITVCSNHKPKNQEENALQSKKVKEKEIENINKVKSGSIEESSLLGIDYISES